jgi:hypothetical protein
MGDHICMYENVKGWSDCVSPATLFYFLPISTGVAGVNWSNRLQYRCEKHPLYISYDSCKISREECDTYFLLES